MLKNLSILKRSTHICFLLLSIFFVSACTSYTTWFSANPSKSTPPTSLFKPKNIALLVPLTGQNSGSGQAIRNGFVAAYDYTKRTMPDAPSVTVIDTNSGNIASLYQEAVVKGADFIVGPLTKEDVEALIHQDHFAVPTLALNTLDNHTKPIANLYQFGLSPQDEAEQAAIRAKQDGHSRALVLSPTGRWGETVAQAFTQKWGQLDGTVINNVTYSTKGNIPALIQNALNTEKSNIDMVFLVAFPSYARQIKPLLTFYGSSDLPVYATSLIYTGIPSTQDHDLDGTLFNDIPWVLSSGVPAWNQIRSNLQTKWGSAYNRSPRLYALGIDAYHLTYAFNQLASGMAGTTGKLILDSNQHIHRTLEWAKFQNGVPQRVQ